jgi:protein-tyrosine phosphatase
VTDRAFTILCVCTGNVARSPAAERLLAHALGSSVRVSSAGTHALVGQGFSPPMDVLVAETGADTSGFAAREVTPAILREADLVLGLTREHRALTVDLAPATVRRSFTLREYARLLRSIEPDLLPQGTPGERARASVPLAGARRRRAGAAEDDVGDPYRRGEVAYATAFAEISRAVRDIAELLRP